MGRDQRHTGATYAKRLAPLLVVALAIVLLAGSPSSAQTAPPKAITATKECPFAPSNVPCHGTTIESVYTFSGYHEGDLKLIWVKIGPDQRSSLTVSQRSQCPECREADKRTFTWHSVASVEITAVYVLRQAGRIEKYQKLPTGKHSGHITLIDLIGGSSPTLLLQGRRIPATPSRYRHRLRYSLHTQSAAPKASTAATHCQYFSRGGPCAPLMSTYDFVVYKEGDLSLIWAKLGPEHKEKVGEQEVFKRTFSWHTVPDVEVTGVYEVNEPGKYFRYKKLPSGRHSGHATLTDVFGDSEPNLVLQGRRVGR